ncbi:MAG TPA: prolipoprotein diacylglyceryl transferase [Tepidisphaeraceae bacterium]|nr:prolipoprotein diacylglyceryl transferase [Tepidisphaeraceae bacterium]
MDQILFRIPFLHIPIYGYGVMMVVGFIGAMYLAQFLARRARLDPEVFANAAILALVFGVIGARLSHVLENLPQYTNPRLSVGQNLFNAINIREGGLTYYGGFLLAFPALVLYGMWKRVPIRTGMDIIAPCLMVGLAFGRVGCFLNGCCYGAQCNLPWATQFPYGSDAYVTEFNQNVLKQAVPRQLVRDDTPLASYMDARHLASLQEPLPAEMPRDAAQDLLNPTNLKSKDQVRLGSPAVRDLAARQHADPVHPAELYNTVTALATAGFLFAFFTLPHLPGRVFAAMMMIEGVFRYLLEMVRVEPAVAGRGTGYLEFLPAQSYSMVVSIFLVLGGLALWYAFGRIAAARGETRLAAGRMAMA